MSSYYHACARISLWMGASHAWLILGTVEELLAALGLKAVPLVEVLGGTPLACADLRALAAEKRSDEPLIAHLGAIRSYGCPACQLGADVALEELGESLLAVGLSASFIKAHPQARETLNALPRLDESSSRKICEQLEQLPELYRRACDAAQVVAVYLRCHPQVQSLCYPGLKDDINFDIAARTLRNGFGPLLEFMPASEHFSQNLPKLPDRTMLHASPSGTLRLRCAPTEPFELISALEQTFARTSA